MQRLRSKKINGSSSILSQRLHSDKKQHSDPRELLSHKTCRFCCYTNQPLYFDQHKLWKIEGRNDIQKILNLSLPIKYSQSQTYYYTKPINAYLQCQRSAQVIKLKDMVSFSGIDGDEWMRRQYAKSEIQNKIHLLTEYYRFHKEIPRLFMIPESDIMNNYHDKKRRIEYFKIARRIEDENRKNPDKPPKGIVGDKPEEQNDSQDNTPQSTQHKDKVYGNLLQDLTLKSTNISQTIQELNQRLDELIKQKFKDFDKQLEKDLSSIKPTIIEDEARIKSFFRQLNETNQQQPQPVLKLKIKRDLQLDDEVLKTVYDLPKYQKPVPQKIIQSPQSARMSKGMSHMMPLTNQPKTSLNQQLSPTKQPFFLSEAIQKLQINTNIQKLSKPPLSISPRLLQTKQPMIQSLYSAKIQPQKQVKSRVPLAQGYQGIQVDYQSNLTHENTPLTPFSNNTVTPLFTYQTQLKQLQSSANSSQRNIYPINNNNQFSKNNSKIIQDVQSPTRKVQAAAIIGSQTQRVSQTHRVQFQKDVQMAIKLQQQNKEGKESKDALSKILSPVQINEFFQLQQMKLASQSNSSQTIRNVSSKQQQSIHVQIVPRSQPKKSQFRQSFNSIDPKSPVIIGYNHQHTKSEMTQQDKLASTQYQSIKRITKLS